MDFFNCLVQFFYFNHFSKIFITHPKSYLLQGTIGGREGQGSPRSTLVHIAIDKLIEVRLYPPCAVIVLNIDMNSVLYLFNKAIWNTLNCSVSCRY